jgi:hypothetical protein
VSSATRQQIQNMMIRRRLKGLQASSAREEVRETLNDCLFSGEFPQLSPETIVAARRADESGEFPSHKVLMACYEDLLG